MTENHKHPTVLDEQFAVLGITKKRWVKERLFRQPTLEIRYGTEHGGDRAAGAITADLNKISQEGPLIITMQDGRKRNRIGTNGRLCPEQLIAMIRFISSSRRPQIKATQKNPTNPEDIYSQKEWQSEQSNLWAYPPDGTLQVATRGTMPEDKREEVAKAIIHDLVNGKRPTRFRPVRVTIHEGGSTDMMPNVFSIYKGIDPNNAPEIMQSLMAALTKDNPDGIIIKGGRHRIPQAIKML